MYKWLLLNVTTLSETYKLDMPPLDARSSCTKHKIHKRQISLLPAAFETDIPANEGPQTCSLSHASTIIIIIIINFLFYMCPIYYFLSFVPPCCAVLFLAIWFLIQHYNKQKSNYYYYTICMSPVTGISSWCFS